MTNYLQKNSNLSLTNTLNRHLLEMLSLLQEIMNGINIISIILATIFGKWKTMVIMKTLIIIIITIMVIMDLETVKEFKTGMILLEVSKKEKNKLQKKWEDTIHYFLNPTKLLKGMKVFIRKNQIKCSRKSNIFILFFIYILFLLKNSLKHKKAHMKRELKK